MKESYRGKKAGGNEYREVAFNYLSLIIGISTVLATTGWILNPNVGVQNTRLVLSTLAAAQASVLAIVFSVTVISLQFVANQYSARLTSLFIEEPMFRVTFVIFVGSVAYDLVLLYLLPSSSSPVSSAGVAVAFAVASVAVVALYRFIKLVINRSSPDELISAIVEHELEPSKVFATQESQITDSIVHPMYPLYSVITSAMESKEYVTVKRGVAAFQSVQSDMMAYLQTEYDKPTGHEYIDTCLEEVLSDYFPTIMIQAFEHEQYELISDITKAAERIGLNGLHCGYTSIAEHASNGLGEAFSEAPITWEGNRIRRPATESLAELTKVTASTAEYSDFMAVFHHLQYQFVLLLRRGIDRNAAGYLVSRYYGRYSIVIFEELIKRYNTQIDDENTNWIHRYDGRHDTLPDEAKALRHFWAERTDFTETLLRYRLQHDEFPFTEGNIDRGWKQFIDKAAENGLDGLATLFCISAIKLAYRVEEIDGRRLGQWNNHFANVRIDYNTQIVDDAFKFLKKGEGLSGDRISKRSSVVTREKGERGLLSRILSDSEGEQMEFETWLEEFEEEVEERTQYILDKHE